MTSQISDDLVPGDAVHKPFNDLQKFLAQKYQEGEFSYARALADVANTDREGWLFLAMLKMLADLETEDYGFDISMILFASCMDLEKVAAAIAKSDPARTLPGHKYSGIQRRAAETYISLRYRGTDAAFASELEFGSAERHAELVSESPELEFLLKECAERAGCMSLAEAARRVMAAAGEYRKMSTAFLECFDPLADEEQATVTIQ